jgi:hypothetical protein
VDCNRSLVVDFLTDNYDHETEWLAQSHWSKPVKAVPNFWSKPFQKKAVPKFRI